MSKIFTRLAAATLMLALAGCGGGEAPAAVTPAPVGAAPTPTPVAPAPGTTPPAGNQPPAGTTPPVSEPPPGGSTPPVGTTPPVADTPTTKPKSAKRGIAYDLADPRDIAALADGVSWWYNWSAQRNTAIPANYQASYQMDYFPMVWNDNYNAAAIEQMLKANPQIKYLLVINEPNLVDQANLTPAKAAAIWPGLEAISAHTGVKLVGPAMTWGTMPGFEDPVVWMDAFYAAYGSANGGRLPQIDYLAFHWYDYGLNDELNRLAKYGKQFWVTEMANWHEQNDGAQIDTPAKQAAQMKEMVAICEGRADVFRYAWFTGRWDNDIHYTNLLSGPGQLTELGKLYLSLPY